MTISWLASALSVALTLVMARAARINAGHRARLLNGPAVRSRSTGWRLGHLAERVSVRRAPAYDIDLGEALACVARSLRSGASFAAALSDAAGAVGGPVGADLEAVQRQVGQGVAWPDALAAWAQRRPQRCVVMAAGGLAVGLQTGTASARVLDALVEAVRIGIDARAEARALSAQARSSVAVLVASPLLFLALTGGLGGGSTGFLFGTPLGWLCVGVGVLLDTGAAFWMRAIVRSVA